MRRFAANIVVKEVNNRSVNHVVEIDDGRVVDEYSLDGEKEAMEWIGGMIVLSSHNVIEDSDNIRISEFINRYGCLKYVKNMYAWHISGIDISADPIISNRNITLLK